MPHYVHTHSPTPRLLLRAACTAGHSNLRKVYRPLYVWGQLSGEPPNSALLGCWLGHETALSLYHSAIPVCTTASAWHPLTTSPHCNSHCAGWFKQTVNDPTASLSAERRGTVSLPDIESSFAGGKTRYSAKASRQYSAVASAAAAAQ